MQPMPHRTEDARLREELADLEAELAMTAAVLPGSASLIRLRERVRAVRLALDGTLPKAG